MLVWNMNLNFRVAISSSQRVPTDEWCVCTFPLAIHLPAPILRGSGAVAARWVAVRSNIRVASAACRSFQEAIQVGLRAGAFSGVLVVRI